MLQKVSALNAGALAWQVALPVQLDRTFSYLDPQTDSPDAWPVQIGSRVLVEFGRSTRTSIKKIGIVVGHGLTDVPLAKLKPIIQVLDDQPFFSPKLFSLLYWLADYYKAPLGQVFHLALPPLARRADSAGILNRSYLPQYNLEDESVKTNSTDSQQHKPPVLRLEQQHAIEQIIQCLDRYQCFLLDGITGSGKTEVYLHVIKAVLSAGKQVLVLVPEIGLTPQMLSRTQERFPGQVVLMHSQLRSRERFIIWEAVRAGTIGILIGTRSAVFAEFADLGLIVVDEEHDTSFKQQEGVRYHGKHLAIKRASQLNVPIILGSATPALETLYHAQSGQYHWLKLEERVSTQPMHWTLVSSSPGKAEFANTASLEARQTGLNPALVASMSAQLEQGHQVLVFINRRGYAPGLVCSSCGWQAICSHCDARLVLHKFPKPRLVCHHCDAIEQVITSCPECASHKLKTMGEGTQKLEDSLLGMFKAYPVIRIDKDSTRRKNQLTAKLNLIHRGEAAILVGTQMLVKGHHFPNISLVVILGIDYALSSPDFRALEKLAQQLVQVSGRAGRGEDQALAIIQTAHVRHPIINQLINSNYHQIAETILTERQPFAFPPYGYMIRLHGRAKSQQKLFTFLEYARQEAVKVIARIADSKDKQDLSKQIKVTVPIEDTPGKKANYYYASLLFHGVNRAGLHYCVKKFWQYLEQQPVRSVRWYFDVDPV